MKRIYDKGIAIKGNTGVIKILVNAVKADIFLSPAGRGWNMFAKVDRFTIDHFFMYSRKTELFIYIEDNNLYISVQNGPRIRLTTFMSTPLFKEENEKIIRDYLQDMIDKGIYLILYTEQGGEDSVEVHLKTYRRHAIVLDYLMRGVQYLFSYDGEKYLTDLKDKLSLLSV